MPVDDSIFIMKDFPDFTVPGFDIEAYNRRFKDGNVIIRATSQDVAYAEHWGCLSIKCAFNGSEHYQSNGCRYTVNDDNFLIFNEGKTYASHIFSKTPVESFTINFSSFFEQTVTQGLLGSMQNMLDEPYYTTRKIVFSERLFKHDDATVTLVLKQLYILSNGARYNEHKITELYYQLLEKMLLLQQHVDEEIKQVKATRQSTQAELYKRLHQVKDYIDSCYMHDISLQQLSLVAHLNSAYLLRQYKKYFSITPYQYIMQQRVQAAKTLLETSAMPVTEVCYTVGYGDVTSFARLFKQTFKLAPEKYRLLHGKKSFFTC